jgi:RHS repeat-associated protein
MERPARDHGSKTLVTTFVYGTHVNAPELIIKGGTAYRIVHDHLGSPRLVVEQSTGTIVQRMDYDEWGIVTLDTNPDFQPFGFAGGMYDIQTKLIRFGARDYDPQVGRSTTKEASLFDGPDTNLYSYVLADPLNLMDPDGAQIVRPPVWPYRFGADLGCAEAVARSLEASIPMQWNDKFKHCLISCEMARRCSPLASAAGGAYKEWKDLWSTIRRQKGHGTFSLRDMLADAEGVACGMATKGHSGCVGDCACCCRGMGYAP